MTRTGQTASAIASSVGPDIHPAVAHYRRAASLCLEYSRGTTQDFDRAANYFRLSAEKGNGDGAKNFAFCSDYPSLSKSELRALPSLARPVGTPSADHFYEIFRDIRESAAARTADDDAVIESDSRQCTPRHFGSARCGGVPRPNSPLPCSSQSIQNRPRSPCKPRKNRNAVVLDTLWHPRVLEMRGWFSETRYRPGSIVSAWIWIARWPSPAPIAFARSKSNREGDRWHRPVMHSRELKLENSLHDWAGSV
jgi:hypothetical protein